MGKRFLKTLTNNLGFKILAVALAFVLWLVVYNLNDPIKTKTFTTTVSVTGKDSVIDDGLWPTIEDSDKTISFSVSAKRSYLNELDDSDFSASADLTNMVVSTDDTSTATVNVDLSCSKYRNSVTFNGTTPSIPVTIEAYTQKQFEVKVSVDGSLSGARALDDDPTANPKIVKIGGPESLVSTIASANVEISVDDNTIVSENQISDRGDLVLLDENGDTIDMSLLDVDEQYQSIAVSIDVLSTKDVPIKCSYDGTLTGGKGVLGVALSEESVKIKGSAEALNSITSIDVGPIDITGAEDDIKTTIDLTGYLPDGVSLVSSSDAKIEVVIQIETNASTTMSLLSSNISYSGLADGQELSFASESTSVIISGSESDIEELSGKVLHGQIDVSGLAEGIHTVSVTLTLDDEKYTWNEVKIQITIGTASDADGNDNMTDAGTNDGNSTSGTGSGAGSSTGSSSSSGNGSTSSSSSSSNNSGSTSDD